jgi:hypothetical protein
MMNVLGPGERLAKIDTKRFSEMARDARQVVEPALSVVGQPEARITVYVSVGNSDDKLSQTQWATYWQVVDNRVRRFADVVHGAWHSLPNQPWQNACWCFEIRESVAVKLKNRLQDACADFGQDSIAWAVASTEFIRPMV